MVECSRSDDSTHVNSGAWLGAVLGSAYKAGRDKVTITTSPALDVFGIWVEQLIAEGTARRARASCP